MYITKITLRNHFPGVASIEILSPVELNGRIVYPVIVDDLKTTVENVGIHQWSAKGFGQTFPQDLIDYIGGKIEDFDS